MKRSNFLKTLFAIPLIPLVGNIKVGEESKPAFYAEKMDGRPPNAWFYWNKKYANGMRLNDALKIHAHKYSLDIPDSKIDELTKRHGGFDMLTILNECE